MNVTGNLNLFTDFAVVMWDVWYEGFDVWIGRKERDPNETFMKFAVALYPSVQSHKTQRT